MLILVRGIPGSGKSTFGKSEFPHAILLENDQFHIHNGKYDFDLASQSKAVAWCQHMTEEALKVGADVVVCNTFTRKRFIMDYKALAEKYGTKFEVYRMMSNFGNIHNVPENVLQRMKDSFEDWEGEHTVIPMIKPAYND